MYLAKFKNNGAAVTAAAYRPGVHSAAIECGDPECHAPVVFRQGTGEGGAILTHGQSFSRARHFATLPNRQHREGCLNKDVNEDPDVLRRSFRDAISDPAKKLLINLNGETGAGLKVRFQRAAQVQISNTGFGQFLRDNKKNYAAIGVKDLAELMDQVRLVKTLGGKEALQRSYVCHHLAVRPLGEVLVGHNEDKLKTLYRRMFDGEDALAVLPDRTIGFPRLLHFIPTHATQKGEGKNGFQGNSVTVATLRGGASRMVLLNGLNIESRTALDKIAEEKEVFILACPVIRPVEARQESYLFKRGEKPVGHKGEMKTIERGAWFLHMDWKVAAEGQIASVPEEKRRLKRDDPPQQRLDL